MDREQLQAILDDLAAFQPYEYEIPVLPTSGAITDRLVQKLKINSYQRKIRNFEVGSTVIKTVPHANIKVVKELEDVKNRVKDAEERCMKRQDGRREIVEQAKLKFTQAQNDVLARESALKKWEDLERNQRESMKSVKNEIENIIGKCNSLDKKIKLVKEVRDNCLRFYKDYYLYVEFMEEVRDNYVCVIPFVKFKQFLDEHYVKKDEKRFRYEENINELYKAKASLRQVMEGPYKKCKETLKEALSYFQGLCEEETKCAKYKDLLYKQQKYTTDLIGQNTLALIGLEELVNRLLKTFPKRLYKNIDMETLQGKLQVIRLSYEAYTVMNELIQQMEEKKQIEKWDLHKIAQYEVQ